LSLKKEPDQERKKLFVKNNSGNKEDIPHQVSVATWGQKKLGRKEISLILFRPFLLVYSVVTWHLRED